jgi:hypothetical protein
MNATIIYHLGSLLTDNSISEQAKNVKEIIISEKKDFEIFESIIAILLEESKIEHDTVLLINKAVMAHNGEEYQGLGKDDFELKSSFYFKLTKLFPEELSFQFKLTECLYLNGNSEEEIAEVFFPAFRKDTENKYSVRGDLFEFFADELNNLLDEKYPE